MNLTHWVKLWAHHRTPDRAGRRGRRCDAGGDGGELGVQPQLGGDDRIGGGADAAPDHTRCGVRAALPRRWRPPHQRIGWFDAKVEAGDLASALGSVDEMVHAG
jgi:hypothetical protein